MPELDFKDLLGGGDGKGFLNKKVLIIGGVVVFGVIVLFQSLKKGEPTPTRSTSYAEPNTPDNNVKTQEQLSNFSNIMMGQLDQSLNTAFSEMESDQNSFQQTVSEKVQEQLQGNTETLQETIEDINQSTQETIQQMRESNQQAIEQNNQEWERKWEQVKQENESVQTQPDEQETSNPNTNNQDSSSNHDYAQDSISDGIVYKGKHFDTDEFTDVVGTDFNTDSTIIQKDGKSYTYDEYADRVLDGTW